MKSTLNVERYKPVCTTCVFGRKAQDCDVRRYAR
jgi:hypothetical protein